MTITPSERVGLAVRGEFPIFAHTCYLNSCSQGALSLRVREAYETYLDGWDANGAEWGHWVERAETMRGAFARLLNAGSDELAITTSVSQGVAALMSALRFEGERSRIVVSDYEFPTVGQISHAQELRGAEVVHVRCASDGSIPPERFADAVDERTAIVCATAVSYRSGHRHDLEAIGRIAHERGALFLVDAYQAAGAVALDPRALGADLMCGGTVKYLLASAGLGFLYVSRELAPQLLPTQTGWFADEDIFRMDISDYSPAADARRFDSGTPPVPNIYAGIAGISQVLESGPAVIEAHVSALAGALIDGLDALGATTVTPRDPSQRGPLVCVRSLDVQRLVRALAADGIVVSNREQNLRIALHLYNTLDDVEQVLAALSEHRELLA